MESIFETIRRIEAQLQRHRLRQERKTDHARLHKETKDLFKRTMETYESGGFPFTNDDIFVEALAQMMVEQYRDVTLLAQIGVPEATRVMKELAETVKSAAIVAAQRDRELRDNG